MVAPVVVNGLNGIAPFYRIRDTAENRECLRAALSEFHWETTAIFGRGR